LRAVRIGRGKRVDLAADILPHLHEEEDGKAEQDSGAACEQEAPPDNDGALRLALPRVEYVAAQRCTSIRFNCQILRE
jgi:hypothetical protein